MVVLDTDVLSLLQSNKGEECANLQGRLATTPESVSVTIITFEEQTRGWLAWIAKAKSLDEQVIRYRKLRLFLDDYKTRAVLDFDQASANRFQDLKRRKIRVGTMDLKIAAVALANQATLLSRNVRDYRKVPGLHVEDWTQPQ